MGISQSKKYTKPSQNTQIQLDYKKEIQPQLKILTNCIQFINEQGSLPQIRQVCLSYKRYSFECPYISRFTLKKILPNLSDAICNEIFYYFSRGQSITFVIKRVPVILLTGLCLGFDILQHLEEKTSMYFFCDKVLYLVFNFMHQPTIRLKHFILMYQAMTFAYCRMTGQHSPPFDSLKKFLLEEYLTSESMEILEGTFEFRRLIEEIQVCQLTRDLFARFEGNVLNAKEKPSVFVLNGLPKYTKFEAQNIFWIITRVYEDNNFEQIQQHQSKKKFRLQSRKQERISLIHESKSKQLQRTNSFRIKNRSYSLRKLQGFGSTIVFNGLVTQTNFHSSLSKRMSKDGKFSSVGFQSLQKKSSQKISSLIQNQKLSSKDKGQVSHIDNHKVKQLTEKKLSNVKLNSLSKMNQKKGTPMVVFLGGKAYTKPDFYQTIQYFNSLSNHKDQIKIKQFYKTFEQKPFIKRQLHTFFNYFDKNKSGSISFQQFIQATYPHITNKLLGQLRDWNIDYKNIYQADKISIKKQNKRTNIQLPEDTVLRIREIFLSFGGQKGYLTFQDIRAAYTTGFTMQECEKIVKDFGVDGKVYIDGFAKMLLPDGFVIENCDWNLKKDEHFSTVQSVF